MAHIKHEEFCEMIKDHVSDFEYAIIEYTPRIAEATLSETMGSRKCFENGIITFVYYLDKGVWDIGFEDK